eukprot:gene8837-6269_t
MPPRSTALHLARRGAKVAVACRSVSKCADATRPAERSGRGAGAGARPTPRRAFSATTPPRHEKAAPRVAVPLRIAVLLFACVVVGSSAVTRCLGTSRCVQASSAAVDVMPLDLSSLRSVRRFAAAFREKYSGPFRGRTAPRSRGALTP